MFDISTDNYRTAFNLYLRKGIAPENSLEILRKMAQRETAQNHSTNLYIWRTAGDGKVRASHDANNGIIFSWANRPPTGHPGEDFGCRCVAEPIRPDNTPLEVLELIASLSPIGLARRIGLGVTRRALRRVLEDKPPPARSIYDRPANAPKNWVMKSSKNNKSVKYVDPKNKHNDIRLQKGNPKSQYPNQRGDYVRWKKDGQYLDKYGKPSLDPEKTHISLDEFNFDLEIFK